MGARFEKGRQRAEVLTDCVCFKILNPLGHTRNRAKRNTLAATAASAVGIDGHTACRHGLQHNHFQRYSSVEPPIGVASPKTNQYLLAAHNRPPQTHLCSRRRHPEPEGLPTDHAREHSDSLPALDCALCCSPGVRSSLRRSSPKMDWFPTAQLCTAFHSVSCKSARTPWPRD